MKLNRIKIPIYFGILEVAVTDNLKETEEKLNMNMLHDNLSFDAYVSNRSPINGLSKYTVLIKPTATPEIIAHEAFHVMSMVFKDRGIDYDVINDEPAAYFLGWIVKQIHLSISKYIIS